MPETRRIEKGAHIATVHQPFDLLGRHRAGIVIGLAGVLILAVAPIRLPGEVRVVSLWALMIAAFVLVNRAVYLVYEVRIYERGLEVDIPRSGKKTAYLPWDAIDWHEFDGPILRYSWRAGGLTVLRGGAYPSRWVAARAAS